MADTRIRQIKIKTGVVKRIAKEKIMYEKEAVQIEEKIEKMKIDGKDEHDIRKQTEVLQESKAMVPDTLKRLRNAVEDLGQVLVSFIYKPVGAHFMNQERTMIFQPS
ncbi:hypothetical protein SNE40_011990 [Patella caerulea]|uniref:Tubulin-specific chaperone A n=1 Tax=Patella caerulea TaxID=87958 RepID=A0AAN8PYX5_PATCE